MEQSVAHQAHNLKVIGSNPIITLCHLYSFILYKTRCSAEGSASVLETESRRFDPCHLEIMN